MFTPPGDNSGKSFTIKATWGTHRTPPYLTSCVFTGPEECRTGTRTRSWPPSTSRAIGVEIRVPSWLGAEYAGAIERLAELALGELPRATDVETTRSMLSVLALWKGARTYARVLVELSEDEIVELADGVADDSDGAG